MPRAQGLAVGPGGEVFVADHGNHALRVISHGLVDTITDNFTSPTYLSGAFFSSSFDDDDDGATHSAPPGYVSLLRITVHCHEELY